jgi:hypothetical protein
MWCIITAGFTLLFRVGELAKGAKFDCKRHWDVAWLRPILRLSSGQNTSVFQPARKFETEITQEKLPLYCENHVGNFVYAYQHLVAVRSETKLQLTDHQDAFALADGSSPTPDWVAGNLKRLCRFLLTEQVARVLEYSNHCLRRGGDSCLNVLKIDPLVAKQLGGRSEHSRSRELYVQRCLEQLASVQKDMLQAGDYTLMQDDVGWTDRIDRNPALSPFNSAELERGDEFASSDSEDEADESTSTIPPEPELPVAPDQIDPILHRQANAALAVGLQHVWDDSPNASSPSSSSLATSNPSAPRALPSLFPALTPSPGKRKRRTKAKILEDTALETKKAAAKIQRMKAFWHQAASKS